MAEHSPWVMTFRPNPAARLRLYCFPYAGGGASAYNTWPARLPGDVEVRAIQYPGRETRWSEPVQTEADALVSGILDGLREQLAELEYAFFGHSMGAMVAYEAARRVRAAGFPEPRLLLLSGRRAPHFRSPPPAMRTLPDLEFLDHLADLNGTPPAVLENKQLMQLLLPILRADFTLDETYRHAPGVQLQLPFAIYGGTDDRRLPEADLRAWAGYTRGPSLVRMFPGDHFYLKDPDCGIFEELAERLQ